MNISVGVYWNDVGIAGWKLTDNLTHGQQSGQKTAENMFSMAQYLHSWDRQADAGCCVLLPAPAQEQPWTSKEPTWQHTVITAVIFLWISKTAMHKPTNKMCLLHKTTWCHDS
jgi:hypothetical protein